MKEVKAYIKKHKIDAVSMALLKLEGLPGFSVVEVRGCGRRHTSSGPDRRMEEFEQHAKVEVVCADDQVKPIIDAIKQAAHTGLRGDGKIYVSTIDQAVSIQTDEQGEHVV